MIIVLNGPLGIGRSTLSEILAERIDGCVMVDGDHLIAVNPPQADELEHLHSTIALLVAHHRRYGCRDLVINHLWRSPRELGDLLKRSRHGRTGRSARALQWMPHLRSSPEYCCAG